MRKTSIHMTRKEREEQLRGFVALCFASLEGQKTSDIAKNAGVCEATVYRLSNGEVSLFTRVGTIQGLGLAAGLYLNLNTYKMGVTSKRKIA